MAIPKLFLLCALALAVLALASPHDRVVKGRAHEAFFRADHSTEWRPSGRAHHAAELRLVFAIRQRMDLVHALLAQVSDPSSPHYGQYLTHADMGRIVSDHDAHDAVLRYLHSEGIRRTESTANKDFITARMTVLEAERLLSTEYHVFAHRASGRRILRTAMYSLPAHIAPLVDVVSNTVHFPRSTPRFFASKAQAPRASDLTTPQLLWKFYSISNTFVSNNASQSVYENLGQSYDPKDLSAFQSLYKLEKNPIASVIGPNDPSACSQDPNNCVEATLDVQYMMAVAQNASTTFWSIANDDPDPFVDFVVAVSNDPEAPLVHSISYGEIEDMGDPSSYKRFDDEVAKLGVRGITVVVASGDDGVANFQARDDKSKCGFHPSFPASAPHVTAVGATMGPEMGGPETACTSALGGGITTGGGFSTVFAQPSYQSDAVSAYLQSGVRLPPSTMYKQGNRGYPDVGTLGHNYNTIVGGQQAPGSGTSASAPVFGAMLTLVNDARIALGKPPVGFVNPALYNIASQVFNDITEGENNCAAGDAGQQTCCRYGFYAAAGWDPLTGLGGVNYPALLAALTAM